MTTYDFGDKAATWESHSCHPSGFEGDGFGISFYGYKEATRLWTREYRKGWEPKD